MNVQLRNAICTSELGIRLDLNALAHAIPGTEYEPERYHALVYRTTANGSVLVNASGKVIVTGAHSIAGAGDALSEFVRRLQSLGFQAQLRPATVQNLVATANLGFAIELNALAARLPDAQYEPEQFPGLIIRVREANATCLVFASGRVVITGCKSMAAVESAVQSLEALIFSHDGASSRSVKTFPRK